MLATSSVDGDAEMLSREAKEDDNKGAVPGNVRLDHVGSMVKLTGCCRV
jgi:hypothetical protein